MSETPPGMASSWVDLSREIVSVSGYVSPLSPRRLAPAATSTFGSDYDYMRMLREAQRETSCRSSARVSPITSALVSQASTGRNSPTTSCASPKSPPNSPRTEMADLADFSEQLEGVYINRLKETEAGMTDLMWDWSSTPSICPPKDWRFSCQSTMSRSCTNLSGMARPEEKKAAASSSSSFFSRKVVYTFVLTNILSLIIGAGIGMLIYRKSDKPVEIFLS